MKTKKNLKSKVKPTDKHLTENPLRKFSPCKSCVDQCAGHGGGGVPVRNGCLCDDGSFQECM